jgi:hypothetical protein
MSRVVIDGPTRDKLLAAGGPVELTDEGGNLIGRFVKYTRIGGHVVEGDWPSDEELDRRTREGKWVPAAEVEARLRNLRDSAQ